MNYINLSQLTKEPRLRLFFLASIFLAIEPTYGASGAGNHVIPWSLISAQAINIVIVLVIVAFLMVRQSKVYFSARASQFRQLVDQAKEEREQAAVKLKEFEKRLSELRSSRSQTIESAAKEALALKSAMKEEADQLSQRIRREAAVSASYEVERAKKVLMSELLNKSVSKARSEMAVQEPDQKRLKSEFVQKIQVVHS